MGLDFDPVAESAINANHDLNSVTAKPNNETLMGKSTTGTRLPLMNLIENAIGPYLTQDTFGAKKLEKADPQQAEYAIAANYVARSNNEGDPFKNEGDTGHTESSMSVIASEGYLNKVLANIFPENESNSGFRGVDIS